MRSGSERTAAPLHWIVPAIIAALLSLISAASAHADPIPAKPERYVVDLANLVDGASETRLLGYLQELEQKTGYQMIVLTVNSLDGASIDDFSLRTAEKWQLGQRGRDNGVLVVIAKNDRKYRIEVGYGAEAVLNDSLAGRIARRYFVPNFKAGNYSGGIHDGTIALIDRIAKKTNTKIEGLPKVRRGRSAPRSGRRAAKAGGVVCMMSLFILVSIVSGLGRRRRHSTWGYGGGWLPWLILMNSSRHGGGWSSGGGFGGGGWSSGGGGFGGGGFGGFGGGGGGGFGGGGASGGW